MSPAGRHRLASYYLFGALVLAAVVLRMGPAILAGLFSYSLLSYTHRLMSRRAGRTASRWLSLAVFVVVALLIVCLLVRFLRQSVSIVPALLSKVLPVLDSVAAEYGLDLPFENLEALRRSALETLAENAGDVTHISGLLTGGAFHALLSIIAAALAFMSDPQELDRRTLFGALRAEFDARARRFVESFGQVLGAQVAVSAINAVLTAAFLIAMRFPHAPFLVLAAFLLGVLPIVGNILSNTLICLMALTISAQLATLALVFLTVLHKAQYLLIGRVIGSTLRIPMWQTLVGILLGEVLLGVPGIILAPAMLHYLREELESLPA